MKSLPRLFAAFVFPVFVLCVLIGCSGPVDNKTKTLTSIAVTPATPASLKVGSTQQLTSTLNSVLLGQNVNNATSLIGKTIQGLDVNNKEVTGKVDKVTITDGKPVLTVGDTTVNIENVRAVLPDADSPESADQLAALLKQIQQSAASQPTASTTPTTTTTS